MRKKKIDQEHESAQNPKDVADETPEIKMEKRKIRAKASRNLRI